MYFSTALTFNDIRAADNIAFKQLGLDVRAMGSGSFKGIGWGRTLEPSISTNNEL